MKEEQTAEKLKPKFQVIKKTIEKKGEAVRIDTETKLEHDQVDGVFCTISDDYAILGGELSLSVDGEEILPEGFEAHLITVHPRISLSVEDVAHRFSEKAKGSKVKGEYTDGQIDRTTYPYTLRIYLITKEDDQKNA